MISCGAYLYQFHIPADATVHIADQIREHAFTQEEEMKAISFMNKLDRNRFGSLRDDLDNALQLGRDEYPATLTDAYSLACRYKKDVC